MFKDLSRKVIRVTIEVWQRCSQFSALFAERAPELVHALDLVNFTAACSRALALAKHTWWQLEGNVEDVEIRFSEVTEGLA